MTIQTSEFDKFDAVMRKVLTVSHEELKVREARMEKATWQKKRAKTSVASRASRDRDYLGGGAGAGGGGGSGGLPRGECSRILPSSRPPEQGSGVDLHPFTRAFNFPIGFVRPTNGAGSWRRFYFKTRVSN